MLWAAASFAVMFGLCSAFAQAPHLLQVAVWLAFGCAFVYVPFVIVSFYREGGMLAVTDEGVTFPPAVMGLGPHQSFRWGTIKFVDFDDSKKQLLLQTDSGAKYCISTRKMPEADSEHLMFALEVMNPGAVWSSYADDFKDGLQNSRLGIESDFTHMWEAELKRRYSVTTFAPHSPGTKLQGRRFTILKQLAFGGFSAVYLAEDDDRQKVVIKELVLKADDSPEHSRSREMFERESRLLAKINHPNIVKVFDYFIEGDRHYLVLDYIDGENLRQLVARKGRWLEADVLALALKMASILEDIHGLVPPLVHRDFTPDNLMITASGELTLVDFGAANQCVSAVTGTLVGKQAYMPIEQIRGKAEPRSDLYAMGCTLYFLISGHDPEPLSTVSVPDVTTDFRQFVEKLTQMEPEQRYASASQVRLALSELLKKRGESPVPLAINRFEQNG
jgi:tRNA A-37 threonylcarbamoyl transferase component Bud32